MKISFLIANLSELYGGIKRILEISNCLVDFGHEVYLFSPSGNDCNWFRIKSKILSCDDFLDFPHEILIYSFHEQFPLVNDSRLRYNDKYFYCTTLYKEKNLLENILMLYFVDKRAYWMKRSLMDKAAKKLANCTYISEWLKVNLGIDSEVVLGGINKENFYPVEVKKEKDKTKILCAGSPKYWKGTDVIVKAAEIVKEQKPNVILETYHGKGYPQSKLAEVYSSADIFVDAQYYLGWNNPIAEAMACKVPVVCGDVGQNKDIAIQGETAILVAVKNPDKYAEAIIRLIENKELRNKLSENAYRKISEFTWEKAAKKLESILESNENN